MATEVTISYTRDGLVAHLREMAEAKKNEAARLGDPRRSSRAAKAYGEYIAYETAADMVADIVTLEASL